MIRKPARTATGKAIRFLALPLLAAGFIAGAAAQPERQPRSLPKPVRTYAELERETGLSKPAALAYGRMAVDVGARDWPTTVSFRCHAAGGHVVSNLAPPPATRVFDNGYYVGDADVSSWAIKTTEGIILIDALTTEQDARRFIVEGLRSQGLDPADIRYILITHEHGDHYGGATYLKKLSGAHIAMSETAWRALEKQQPSATSPVPARDVTVADGERVTLGDTGITVVHTPGHTPGTISFILPVHADGQMHMAALWGGNGFPAKVEDRRTFLSSIDHFADYTGRAAVDVELSIHGDTDDLIARLEQRRRGGKANPFLVGREAYLRYEEIYRLCSRARMAERGD